MGGSSIIVATDLDGTLLDAGDYSYVDAVPALRRLTSAGVRVIFCSSKTAAEIWALQDALSISEGFVAENGAVLWNGQSGRTLTCRGRPVAAADAALRRLREQYGYQYEYFAEMPLDRLMELTGLERGAAERARQRLCTEPVWWASPSAEARRRWRGQLAADGWQTLQGGRFETVGTAMDKAAGLHALLAGWGIDRHRCRIIAAGDGANDRSLLRDADCAIVFPGRDGRWFDLGGAHRRAAGSGPAAWAAEIERAVAEMRQTKDGETKRGRQ